MNILISSKNKDKIKEIKNLFDNKYVNLVTLDKFPNAPDVIEDGETLYDNALKKAKLLSEYTGMATISDDTGLEVDALDGRPGVYSARYAGENVTYDDNVNKMIKEITPFPEDKRTAAFKTVAVYYSENKIIAEEGKVDGVILTKRRGSGGFGYDPIFYLEEVDKTYAELTSDEKNKMSHRARAFKKLIKRIETEL